MTHSQPLSQALPPLPLLPLAPLRPALVAINLLGYPQQAPNGGSPKWMVYRETPINIDDLGVPLFQETSKPIRKHQRFGQNSYESDARCKEVWEWVLRRSKCELSCHTILCMSYQVILYEYHITGSRLCTVFNHHPGTKSPDVFFSGCHSSSQEAAASPPRPNDRYILWNRNPSGKM